jgi:hypothetical protein
MTDEPSCPECGSTIRPSDAVARHPDGLCHARCLPILESRAESTDDAPPT